MNSICRNTTDCSIIVCEST